MDMDALLKRLVDEGGSDLHLMVGMPPAIRVLGDLKPLPELGVCSAQQLEELLLGILDADQRDRFANSAVHRNELDFSYGVSGVGRFRFNIHRQRGTIAAVARAVPVEVPTLEALNLPGQVAEFADFQDGLVLVTGATGSGKSTTLAALIDRINEVREGHIITIEEPVEYLHKSKRCYVTQREVGELQDTLSFGNALKYALRQDPDVILVGEMRDYETISVALTAAETGHLVLGTLHTTGAAQSVSRIIDVFPADQQPQVAVQLASVLRGVISQVLLLDGDGKSRQPAVELMKVNSGIASMIREKQVAGIYQAIETGAREGMMTLDQSLVDLVGHGRARAQDAMPYLRTETARRKVAAALTSAFAA